MTDDIWKRVEIESPCIQLCVIHPQARICMGCFRTGDEIAAWSRMSPEMRQEIMSTLAERARTIPKSRKGGRAARIKRN